MAHRMTTPDHVVPELLTRLRAQHADAQIWFGRYSGQFLAIAQGHLIAATSASELAAKINELPAASLRRTATGQVRSNGASA